MGKRRSFFLFLLAVVFALGAAWVANNWMLARMTPSANAATLTVLTAASAIHQNQIVKAEDLQLVEMPPNLIPASALRDPDAIIGKQATQSVFPGELLFAGRFVPPQEESIAKVVSTVRKVVEPDLRAMAIQIDDIIGMGTYVRPGSKVDVLAARDGQPTSRLKPNRSPATIATIVQNVQILSVDQASLVDDESPLMKVNGVTVEVSPYQAEILAAAAKRWRLILAIRPVES